MKRTLALAGLTLVVATSCSKPRGVTQPETQTAPPARSVLLAPWTGNYGGVPPWDKVNPTDFPAAFDAAIAEAKAETDAIANDSTPATFENTFIPLENSGRTLGRLESLYSVHASNLNVGPMGDIEAEVDPKLAAYGDSLVQNKKLFDRIAKVYAERSKLREDQQRLVEKTYKSFVRQGAALSDSQKIRLSEINQELSKLSTQFSQRVLKDEDSVIWVTDAAELAGLTPAVISGYKARAQELGQPAKWAVSNTRSAVDPLLTFCTSRGLRERVWKAFVSRGDNGDANDTNAIVSKILALRTERAKMLGYASHAHLALAPRMAQTPQPALDLMLKVWPKAVARVKEEVADMQKLADKEPTEVTIEPWDYRFYAEKVRKDRYDLNSQEVSQYLQLEKMVEAIHWMAQEVFGLTLKQISDAPVFHPDVRVYEVTNAVGKHVGLWYFDPYARKGKRSGAWMTSYRSQENMDGWITPIVSNNSNFVKTADGKPVLITWDDADTLFHEFGHALHGLLSNVTYPSQSGTSVPRDYVEFPSQVIEHWLPTKEVLSRFALHYETGKPMPEELVKKLDKASKFNQGFATVEYLSSALVDMKVHMETGAVDPRKFEKETLAALGMPKEMVMRHRLPHFLHLFVNSYDAGYYGYLWADTLTADAAEFFEEQKDGFYEKKAAQSMIDNIFSVGDTIDPAEGFRRFRGRAVDTDALLRKRGFPVSETPEK